MPMCMLCVITNKKRKPRLTGKRSDPTKSVPRSPKILPDQRPFGTFFIDSIGVMPTADYLGNKYGLVAVCQATGMTFTSYYKHNSDVLIATQRIMHDIMRDTLFRAYNCRIYCIRLDRHTVQASRPYQTYMDKQDIDLQFVIPGEHEALTTAEKEVGLLYDCMLAMLYGAKKLGSFQFNLKFWTCAYKCASDNRQHIPRAHLGWLTI